MLKRFVLITFFFIPQLFLAQSAKNHSALDRLGLAEGYYGYKLYYPGDNGELSLVNEVLPSTGKAEDKLLIQRILNKNYFRMTVNGGGLIYELNLGFDQFRDKYVVVAFENAPGLLDVYQGSRNTDKTLQMDNLESGTHFLDANGTKVHNRLTFKNMTQNSFTLEVEATIDFGKSWFSQARYEFMK